MNYRKKGINRFKLEDGENETNREREREREKSKFRPKRESQERVDNISKEGHKKRKRTIVNHNKKRK